MNPLTKFCNWYLRRKMRKQQENKQDKANENIKKIHNQLKELYSFVKWLNTRGLKNRRQKKSFWKAVRDGKPVMEEVMANLIVQYDKKILENEKK